jgi:alkanesulfonate monooxygenase SsuD/methylene tetrahydromethanopterin reductase-like flavin-dependent oxidoreductase (luciferase family)
MQYAIAVTNAIDTRALVELAQEAEQAGWDGVFYWDVGPTDVWMALAAVALNTTRVKLGPLVSPLPKYPPWKVAMEAATLDVLSNGRAILPVGLGVVDFERMGVTKDYKIRAKMLDEELAILNGLWSGQPFSHQGNYYQVEETTGPQTVQKPRVPIWVVGGDKQSQLRRAARWDGAMVGDTPAEVKARKADIERLRTVPTPLDIITEESTPGDDPAKAAAIVREFADAGVTWWLEAIWNKPWEEGGFEGMRKRVRQGPPRVI